MFPPGSLSRRLLLALASLALTLRVLIPVGFMPSSVSTGWYLELCPDGMPAEVMVALFGEHHAHHHHGDHGSDNTFYECDYGGGTLGAALVDCAELFPAADPATDYLTPAQRQRHLSAPTLGFRSRAPPSDRFSKATYS